MERLQSIFGAPRALASLILGLGGLTIYLINFPGSMEYDSFVQLVEARTQSYSNWHPPVMSWLIGLSDALPGPVAAWFNAFTMALLVGALIGIAFVRQRTHGAAVGAAAVLLALPQIFLQQGVLWKDTLFANAVLAGFVALALAARWWPRRGLRLTLCVLAAALLALAVLTRQNGVVVVPCAALALGILAARRDGARTGVLYGAGIFAATALIAFGGNAALQTRADDYPARQEQFKYLRLYDLTGMVYRDLDLPLEILAREAPKLEHIIRTEAVARWSPQRVDTLILSPRILQTLDETSPEVLARQWRQTVGENPLLYLTVRTILFRWVFQPPNVGLCYPTHVGDEGDPEDLAAAGMQPRMDGRDVVLLKIGHAFERTPIFSHALFSLIGLGVLAPLLRRRRDGDVMMAGVILAAFVFAATFFPISIACDYRYLYLIDLSAIAGLFYLACDWKDLRRFYSWAKSQP